jgi:hypothetical protein
MPTAKIAITLKYGETVRFDRLQSVIRAVVVEAKVRGALDLPAEENCGSGVAVTCVEVGQIWPSPEGATVGLKYTEAFDFEDLRTMFHNLLDDAMDRGALDLPASGRADSQLPAKCVELGQVWPDWLDEQ